MEADEMAGLDEISLEVGKLKEAVSTLQRQTGDAHRVIFDTLKSIERTVTIGSVEIPAIKKQMDSHDTAIGDLEKEKHERRGAIWGMSMTSGAVGGLLTAVAEFFSRHG